MEQSRLRGYLRLMRPANLPTAAADILAGVAIAGGYPGHFPSAYDLLAYGLPVLLLCLASALLYAGGVVLNDVFDASLDAVERPERPIPSGLVSLKNAAIFGGALLLAGCALAFWLGTDLGLVALLLTGGILFYDSLAKKHDLFGPLVMGSCRALNLWLGISLVPLVAPWKYLWVPLLYIFAVTAVSRGEVHGSHRPFRVLAAFLYAVVIVGTAGLIYWETGRWLWPLAFLLLLAVMVYRPLVRAIRDGKPASIRAAVKGGVLGIVALDASWAAGYGPWWLPLLVVLLFPLAAGLARRFAIT